MSDSAQQCSTLKKQTHLYRFLSLKQGPWVGMAGQHSLGMAPWDWVLSLASGELAEE